jgi:hypothetical protein
MAIHFLCNVPVPSYVHRHDITEILLKVALNTINQPRYVHVTHVLCFVTVFTTRWDLVVTWQHFTKEQEYLA